MSRFSSSTLYTAAGLPHTPFALFVDLDFASGAQRFSSLDRSYTFGGHTFTGIGTFTDMGDVQESMPLSSNSLSLTLSGDVQALIDIALAENYHGRTCTFYWAYINPDTNEPVDTPESFFTGFIDTMVPTFDDQFRSISVNCEDELLYWSRSIDLNYNDADHKSAVDSTDRFFDLVHQVVGKTVTWGKGPTDILAGMRYVAMKTTIDGTSQALQYASYLLVFL